MKIVHVITSLESGGAERMLSNIVNYDKENDHTVITILKSKNHYNIEDNVNVINLNLKNTLFNKVRSIFLIGKVINSLNPGIVQTWLKLNYFAPIFKLCIKEPKYIINIRHGVNKKYNILNRFIDNKILNSVDGKVFVSKSSIEEYKESGIYLNNSIVIPNGFQINDIASKRFNDRPLKLGYVGRKNILKNQEMLFKAFNIFSGNRSVELHVAGKNMTYKSFENIVSKDANTKIVWYGEINNSYELYEKIDVLILTSITEGFPNVVGEAMSIGVPVISTNAGESWDIIKDSGYKIGLDYMELVEILEDIYNNPAQLKEKSQKAYRIIRDNYTLQKIVEEYKKYYKEVLR